MEKVKDELIVDKCIELMKKDIITDNEKIVIAQYHNIRKLKKENSNSTKDLEHIDKLTKQYNILSKKIELIWSTL